MGRMSRDVVARTGKRQSGCLARKGVVSSATLGSAVGTAASVKLPGERGLGRMNVLAHGARVADDAPRPFEHALAFRRQSVKARAAVDEEHPKCVLELFDA